MPIAELLACQDELSAWRRHLHQYPEVAFEERRTAQFVADKLASFGIEVHRGLAVTGVVGVLRCGPGPAIGLRADMDALAIEEANDFPHRSRHPGRMHACGHDGHTAMLLGAARHLARTRRFAGTLYFIFQPAEENEGGGRRMVEEGLFERFPMQAVFGLHNIPGIALGRFAALPGPAMASFDVFEIVVEGRGAHAAMPQQGVDAIVIASELVLALQSVVSRNLDPHEAAVLSVTQLQAGETWNVLPDSATLRGTVRAFDEAVRRRIEQRLGELAEHICAAHGGSARVRYERRYPPTLNDAGWTRRAAQVIVDTFGADALLTDVRPLMAAEDFAYMLQACPGCYVWLGNGDDAGGCTVHNPHYDFNDEALVHGASYWVRLAETILATPERP
ncbi:amidohydrolase [Stutzerimonas kirkiae]|uniref:Amidohydrolase n=1 Tax=Stutzerimonas kirkiae TaxID=2211392 RepID=A0A4Q9RAR7_9GAMM|nr:M20 aminoacylase family protein [Stutzerimonas kirkiae]TBU97879.1 amidohydrolase [Stutzerimonas kirkiae]TBV04605.1 amidohydrolase [Stutzerimonas kirkiae]TBV16057.1 amidohydrolase [Stutzerimonas kirkiae]